MVVALEDKLKQTAEQRPKSNLSKDLHTSQLENQLQEMSHYCTEIEQKLSMKEYEINGLKDKLGYLEEQLHLKNEEVSNNGRLLQ
jgi:Fe-S-cluster containining protein